MGRKKAAAKDTAKKQPETIEGLNDEQLQALTFQHKQSYEAALAAKKKAEAAFKNVCKLAHAELGEHAIDDIKDMIALESEEGEARIKANINRQLRVARWMGLPVGSEPDMFDAVDRTPIAERARAEGKRAGLQGAPRKPSHDPSTEAYREWMTGYDEGQAVLAEGFKKPGETFRDVADKGEAHIREVSKLGTAKPTHTVQQ